ncbi:MAG: hypothetical protein R2815_00070 [Flavobacteriales bacterium]
MRTTLLPLAFLSVLSLHAQWTTPNVNTPVSDDTGVGATTPLSAPGPEGSTYATWFENVTGEYILKMQRLDASGNTMWSQGGIIVSAEDQNSALFRYDLKSDHAGNAIVAFQDERSGVLDVVAYKISPLGLHMWPGGIPLWTQNATGLAPVIGVLENDRIVFAWNTDRSPPTVAYQIFEPNGTTSGFPLEIGGTGITGRPRVIAISDGGFWLQYVHQTGNFLSPGTLQVVYCDANGVAGPPITIATSTVSGFTFPDPVPDGHDGFYVAFNTGNVANANLTDVCVQRLRGNGTTWNSTGVPVENGVLTQRYTGTSTPALMTDDDGLMMVYSFTNLSQSEGGIAVQKIDTAGAVQFGATGSIVVASTSARPEPFGTQGIGDGVVTAFTTGEFGSETAHALRIDHNGAVVSPPALIDLATTPSSTDDASMTPFRNGQAVAVWQDERNGGTIYAQPIQLSINTTVAETDDAGILLLGGAQPGLLFQRATAAATLHITDAQGRLVHTQRLAPQAEGARVVLPVERIGHGMYFITLELPGQRFVKRLVR